jgi:hypothetical protein
VSRAKLSGFATVALVVRLEAWSLDVLIDRVVLHHSGHITAHLLQVLVAIVQASEHVSHITADVGELGYFKLVYVL